MNAKPPENPVEIPVLPVIDPVKIDIDPKNIDIRAKFMHIWAKLNRLTFMIGVTKTKPNQAMKQKIVINVAIAKNFWMIKVDLLMGLDIKISMVLFFSSPAMIFVPTVIA